jgi:cation transport regulator ChaC
MKQPRHVRFAAEPVSMGASARVWYFAYGSNMQRATFVERRGMRPLRSIRAELAGYRLTFDLPVGPGERGVANLVADPSAVVCGVAHRITMRELAFLDQTEGVPHGVYERVGVELAGPDGGVLHAQAYVSAHGKAGRKPSPRYMGLLLEGALEHGLPDSYVAWLERFELALDERESD